MICSEREVRDAGHCGRVTNRGEEACKTSTRNAHSAGFPETSGDPPRAQPQKLLAYVQNNRQRRGADECVACRTRTAQLKDIVGQACSPSLNRRMRTRMSGGVGRVIREDGPYPITRRFVGVVVQLVLQPICRDRTIHRRVFRRRRPIRIRVPQHPLPRLV